MQQSRISTSPKWLMLAIVLIGGALFAAWQLQLQLTEAHELYREFVSPDGGLRVEVWRDRPLFATAPGQGSDAPGEVRLIAVSGEILARVPVEMVQMADEVDWSDGRIRIKFVADWDRQGRSN